MSDLAVSEVYGDNITQGEGKSSGKLVTFLRLANCNLQCDFCDTPYTWNWIGTKYKHSEKFDKKKEVYKMMIDEVKKKIDSFKPRRLVISGGEPFLQQKQLIPLLKMLQSEMYTIEVETNGTIQPTEEFLDLVDQINCSPKTSNSGVDNRVTMRYKPKALKALSLCGKANFKFVVDSKEDMVEVLDLVETFDMQEVYLMPKGRTREEQLAKQGEVLRLAREHSFYFSPRLHVLEFDAMRGV